VRHPTICCLRSPGLLREKSLSPLGKSRSISEGAEPKLYISKRLVSYRRRRLSLVRDWRPTSFDCCWHWQQELGRLALEVERLALELGRLALEVERLALELGRLALEVGPGV